ncbi:MAG: Na/Pi cotransporter family protein, partial [Bacteroidetes bacterium]
AAGYSLFGFGVLFLGMKTMSDAMVPLREWPPFIHLLLKLENPLLGILAGTVFTALIQSSSAFIGIIIVLASQGLLSLDAAIPLLLGSNLGTTATAILSSLKSGLEAKKVAIAFLIIKFFSVILFAGWTIRLGTIVEQITPEVPLPRLIANSHTFINLVLMAVVLPITPLVASLVDRITGKSANPEKTAFRTLYLDEGMITTPSIALQLAKQEIIRMGMIVCSMFNGILKPFIERDFSQLDKVFSREEKVNFLRDAIKEYLLKINRGTVKASRVNESFQMLYTLNEFEKIADIISGNLAIRAEKWLARDYRFSESGKKDLTVYHGKIGRQLRRALEVFEETNLQKAALLKQKHKEYRLLSMELEKQHYARIMEGIQESAESSTTHLEILALFATIDSHATNIARIALEWNQKAT